MLVRIVRMEFLEDKIEEFKSIFEKVNPVIETFEGCQSVKIYQDNNKSNVFYTYSIWDNEKSLDNYRNSDFFKNTWDQTKKLFADKPQAFSLIDLK